MKQSGSILSGQATLLYKVTEPSSMPLCILKINLTLFSGWRLILQPGGFTIGKHFDLVLVFCSGFTSTAQTKVFWHSRRRVEPSGETSLSGDTSTTLDLSCKLSPFYSKISGFRSHAYDTCLQDCSCDHHAPRTWSYLLLLSNIAMFYWSFPFSSLCLQVGVVMTFLMLHWLQVFFRELCSVLFIALSSTVSRGLVFDFWVVVRNNLRCYIVDILGVIEESQEKTEIIRCHETQGCFLVATQPKLLRNQTFHTTQAKPSVCIFIPISYIFYEKKSLLKREGI